AIVIAYKNNDVFARANTNINGEANLTIHPLTPGELKITATRHNSLSGEKTIIIKQGIPEPVIIYQNYEIDDSTQSNPNRILEPGETAGLKLTFLNIGLSPATNINLTLSTVNPDISILASTTFIDTISPDNPVQATSLVVSARSSALPGSSPELFALVHSDQGEFGFWFSLDLGYPGRTWVEIDTGICALTVTARGTIGFDISSSRQGKGFRYPKSDTTGLNIASFSVGNSADYLVDRFYNQSKYGFDQDWRLHESLRVRLPLWNSDEFIYGGFTDEGHPQPKGLLVEQKALGLNKPGADNFVVLIYDIKNTATQPLLGLYAGILADFDVKINDRFHDIAFTLPGLNTAVMSNIQFPNRYLGVKLLYPQNPVNLTCIDHSRYVYPDSALTEEMKFRILNGTLGAQRSDRPYNWSIAVATGPFDLLPNGKQRVAFAFIAASDSISYIASCSASQNWFNTNVGIIEEMNTELRNGSPTLSVSPNPFNKKAKIHYSLPFASQVSVTAFDITGRKVITLINQTQPAGSYELFWQPENLAQGVYFIKLQAAEKTMTYRCVFLQ
ncbi:MAG: T9SS type A sorting domain-containing protein, partial [candidate division WOR-3 bacterium]